MFLWSNFSRVFKFSAWGWGCFKSHKKWSYQGFCLVSGPDDILAKMRFSQTVYYILLRIGTSFCKYISSTRPLAAWYCPCPLHIVPIISEKYMYGPHVPTLYLAFNCKLPSGTIIKIVLFESHLLFHQCSWYNAFTVHSGLK